ncbi:hypothetical protein SEPCBS119000_006417 [Sporothrix epigloea]|uniref:Acyltransferase 3 domain-containing protein n=1 Tax=Sporothrix epigloea TaxID=1892477 RepID=A0ABP0E746_9PEZI
MAPNANRPWGTQAYDHVPTEDTLEEGANEKSRYTTATVEPWNGSSSGSSSGSFTDADAEADAGFSPAREKHRFAGSSLPTSGLAGAIFALPILALRITYLCWLVATRPIYRFLGIHGSGSGSSSNSGSNGMTVAGSSAWPGTYEKLGAFKVLVPSFLQPVDPNAPIKKMHPTAWLDGMRGVASFFVVCTHISVVWFNWHIHNGYGMNEHEHWLIQLPFLRLAISGPPHVATFFIISGYALSYKPIKLSRMGRFVEANDAIASSAFRRWPRLFFMPMVISFIVAVMTWLDLFATRGWGGVAIPSRSPPRVGTLFGQIGHWIPSIIALTDPFSHNMDRGGRDDYDKYQWTLPVEFECSMMLFLCQLCFNRLRPRARLVFMFGLATFCMKYIYWQYFLFLMGMILCELQFEFAGGSKSLASGNVVLPTTSSSLPPSAASLTGLFVLASAVASRVRRFMARYHLAIGITTFIACLYAMSTPEAVRGAVGTPGFMTMIKMVPQHHQQSKKTDYFWVPLGASLAVFTVDRTPALQRMFTSRIAQYMGSISYSLYLVHGTVIFSVGHWLVRHTVSWTGASTQLHYAFGLALCAVPLWMTLIFCADLAARTLDKWSLSMGRRLYDYLAIVDDKPAAVTSRMS